MKNLLEAIAIAKEEVLLRLNLMNKGEEVEDYKEFIDVVYDGDSKQFKDDLDYTFSKMFGLEFITDDMEIIETNGEIISYRKFINILKKEMWGNLYEVYKKIN
jgi:hypothetical protein